ncbi:hypothetical protein [Myxococcus sp. SDU36]|uniref:hypothetical protein n=1 Tax=Myxococcus sp. SDU36 TaxID=2831967 RepID=UPI0025439F61|nr:hypothetical protein [Myxococcus sp. SDU36]WIG98645.1 hypothetical protein KGD87_15340 [Myxococcus sp. SDU36]
MLARGGGHFLPWLRRLAVLVIRQVQHEAFTAAAEGTFVRRIEDRLRRFWPHTCETLGPAGLTARVTLGLERARAHGASRTADLERYLNLMFLLGEHFDTDPALPWARAYLTAPGPISTRLTQLSEHAQAEMHETGGAPS